MFPIIWWLFRGAYHVRLAFGVHPMDGVDGQEAAVLLRGEWKPCDTEARHDAPASHVWNPNQKTLLFQNDNDIVLHNNWWSWLFWERHIYSWPSRDSDVFLSCACDNPRWGDLQFGFPTSDDTNLSRSSLENQKSGFNEWPVKVWQATKQRSSWILTWSAQ